jgi:hypothetical protein
MLTKTGATNHEKKSTSPTSPITTADHKPTQSSITTKPTAKSTNLPATTTPTKPPAKSSAPKYIPLADLIAYRKKGLTLQEIGTLTGCTKVSVCQRLKDVDLEGLENFKDYKDKVFEDQQRGILKTLTPDRIKTMSPGTAITAVAILEDKIRAIRGQATEIIEHRQLQVDLNRAIDQLRKAQPEAQEGVVDVPVLPVSD